MTFEPQKFSILLPGALLTWLVMGEVGPVVLGHRYALLAGASLGSLLGHEQSIRPPDLAARL